MTNNCHWVINGLTLRASTLSKAIRYHSTLIVFDAWIKEEWRWDSTITDKLFKISIEHIIVQFELINIKVSHSIFIIGTCLYFIHIWIDIWRSDSIILHVTECISCLSTCASIAWNWRWAVHKLLLWELDYILHPSSLCCYGSQCFKCSIGRVCPAWTTSCLVLCWRHLSELKPILHDASSLFVYPLIVKGIDTIFEVSLSITNIASFFPFVTCLQFRLLAIKMFSMKLSMGLMSASHMLRHCIYTLKFFEWHVRELI